VEKVETPYGTYVRVGRPEVAAEENFFENLLEELMPWSHCFGVENRQNKRRRIKRTAFKAFADATGTLRPPRNKRRACAWR
jgi:hypothetical protein